MSKRRNWLSKALATNRGNRRDLAVLDRWQDNADRRYALYLEYYRLEHSLDIWVRFTVRHHLYFGDNIDRLAGGLLGELPFDPFLWEEQGLLVVMDRQDPWIINEWIPARMEELFSLCDCPHLCLPAKERLARLQAAARDNTEEGGHNA